VKTIHSGLSEAVKDQILDAGNALMARGQVGTSLADVIAEVASGAVRDAVQVGVNLRRTFPSWLAA